MNKLPDDIHHGTNFQRVPVARVNRPSRLRSVLWVLAAIAAIGLLWWLIAGGASKPKAAPPPPPVRVTAAVQKDVTVTEHTIGTVVSNATVQVTSRVEGQLITAGFKEGDIVHKGDLLFRLDPRPFQAALETAIATQNKDQAQLVSAHNDASRYTALQSQGAASKSQTDQFVANSKALGATVVADKANVDAARLNLLYTQIRSPIDGKTGPILVQPGNMIPENGTSPLVTITQIQPIKVSFSLPQVDLPRIQERERANTLIASIGAHDASGKPIEATVDFVGNAVSATTGTIELRATYANADGSLVPGQLVDVTVALAALPKTIVVPSEAINIGPETRYLYVIGKDNKAELRPVKVLFDAGATTAVSGEIKPGELVITDGQLRVIPGQPVTVQKPAGHSAAKS